MSAMSGRLSVGEQAHVEAHGSGRRRSAAGDIRIRIDATVAGSATYCPTSADDKSAGLHRRAMPSVIFAVRGAHVSSDRVAANCPTLGQQNLGSRATDVESN